ncbi:MAG: glycoside hydrolase family 2 TIM barrel-domain containing protein [Henriciella sp.]
MSSLPLPLSQLFSPRLTSLGRLDARGSLQAYPNEQALENGTSPWRTSLDGDWRFQLVAQPDAAAQDWMTVNTADAPWRDIKVPGVWTRQNTGDLPHYANWQMPFDSQKPPAVPDENATGLYRKTFSVSDDGAQRQTVLHVGGFESLALVWCNGSFIGMAKDSRLPSEYDLSGMIGVGENELAIMDVRWCDATWIEDQDHWNHGGLHRSVWIESRAATHISDIIVDTDFDADQKTGTAFVRVPVAGDSAGWTVQARLETSAGAIVSERISTPVEQFDTTRSTGSQWAQSYAFKGYAAELDFELRDADPWSAEQPNRYRMVSELVDPNGDISEVHETWIGFTRIETGERRLRVNGKPVVLIGVNRHDHHPENGKTCSRADIRAELVTMKQNNINAIRTAHYPNDPVLLDLADEMGFYVIDEANVECHARWSEVAHHPDFLPAIVERTTRMIARDRNHPCIIGWSLGNEAGHGPAQDAAAAAARHLDPSRFVHYEGAVSLRLSFPFGRSPETTQQSPSATERAATDVVCPMYPPIDHITDWAQWAEETGEDDRPLILCEFSHAMGNSNGSLATYVDAFFEHPALAGGFVWDWRDQGLAETDSEGRFYWAYGGHYGDQPNDANFNINGLVGPDGVPHPALREYKWAARPVRTVQTAPGRYLVENRRVFQDTSDLSLMWQLQCNGETIASGEMSPIIPAGQTETISIELPETQDATNEWHILLTWRLRDATEWCEAGHVVAWDQHALSNIPMVAPRMRAAAALRLQSNAIGEVTAVNLPNGKQVIGSTITPCLWRAPTDNDGGKPGSRPLFQNIAAQWVEYGLHELKPGALQPITLPEDESVLRAYAQDWVGANGDLLRHQRIWRRMAGLDTIEEHFLVPEAWQDLPRVGIRFEVPKALQALEWFGLGPDESYPDRKSAQTVGVWRGSVADQYHPYVRPQEYGAREQCRWFRLTDEAGEGIEIGLPEPLSFTVRPFHDHELNEAETLAELPAPGTTEVHIDVGMRGLGTAACGPDALAPYLLGPGAYQFTWTLKAITAGD